LTLGYLYNLSKLRKHVNKTSDVKIGKWWDVMIRFVVPAVLILLLIISIMENLKVPYMGYPVWSILIAGILPIIFIITLSLILQRRRR